MEEEKKVSTKRKTTKKVTTTKKKTTTRKSSTTKKAAPKRATTKKSTGAKKTTSKKTAPKKSSIKKTTGVKKTTTKKTSTTRKKSPVKKTTAKQQDFFNTALKEKRNNMIMFISLVFLVIIIFGAIIYKKYFIAPSLSIEEVFLKDDSLVVVKFQKNSNSLKDKVYCMYTLSDKKPDINDKNWKLISGNECSYILDENIYHVYLKNENDTIFSVKSTQTIGTVKNMTINEDKYYLAVNDTLKLKVKYDKLGYVEDKIKWSSSNPKIARVSNGVVKALSNGNVKITASILGKSITSEITVTNLITKRPTNGFDYDKKDLSCNIFSSNDNELLDEILKFKVKKVGNKTRAGVVEAARFLTLDFPYKISYFYENGRLGTNKIDGEGRYYHKGLYLNESKYESISHSRKKPKTWGCPLYSVPDKKSTPNGLDCSGFVTWALLNGGFNPGDIGAGITSVKDLTDLGTMKKITNSLAKSNQIKVGDLLHNTWNSGHIAIIVGIDSDYYYVAQAIWFDEEGVIISKYKKSELKNKFKEVILMDKYYKKDGKLTNMW